MLDRMDTRAIVAANLRALMQLAEDEGRAELASQNQLAKKSGVGQKTISAILAEDQAAGIDTLQKLAQAYKLQAWQLLVPNLHPEVEPVALTSETARDFYESAIAVARGYVPERETTNPQTTNTHRHTKSPTGKPAGKTPTKTRTRP